MSKKELITSITKAVQSSTCLVRYKDLHAKRTIDFFVNTIGSTLNKDGVFRYPGFGSFTIAKRTGKIEFKAAKAFNEMVFETEDKESKWEIENEDEKDKQH